MKYDFPKIDLHLHLGGSMIPALAYSLAKERGIDIPWNSPKEYEQYLVDTRYCGSLQEYLERFKLAQEIMQDYDALYKITYTLIEDLANSGVKYAEIRYAPQYNSRKGLSQEDTVIAVLDGRNAALSDFSNIDINIIACAMNIGNRDNFELNYETAYLVKKYQAKGLVALDLAGSEGAVDMNEYRPLFELAHKLNINTTIHAGESAGYSSLLKAIKFQPNRIGHGVQAIDSSLAIQQLISNNIGIEVCISSNIQCNIYDSFKNHPAKKLYDLGVRISLNTDNMALANTTLDKEYDIAIEKLGFLYNDIIQTNINAVAMSFMNEEKKEGLTEELSLCKIPTDLKEITL